MIPTRNAVILCALELVSDGTRAMVKSLRVNIRIPRFRVLHSDIKVNFDFCDGPVSGFTPEPETRFLSPGDERL